MGILVGWGGGKPTSARPVSATSEMSLWGSIGFADHREAIVRGASLRSIVEQQHPDFLTIRAMSLMSI